MNIQDRIKDASEFFGCKEFKKFQSDVVVSVINGRDVFLMSPTRSGKSLTYEMTPIVVERLGKKVKASVIIVNPLVALVEAQIEKLECKGLNAVHLGKDTTSTDLGKCQYIFASPKMLLKVGRDALLSSESQENVAAMLIDESHCIIE